MGQRAAPQVYQAEPPQQGWCGNLITEINCLFPGSVCIAGEEQLQASKGEPEVGAATPLTRQELKPGAQSQEDPGQAAQSVPLPRCRDGGSGREQGQVEAGAE